MNHQPTDTLKRNSDRRIGEAMLAPFKALNGWNEIYKSSGRLKRLKRRGDAILENVPIYDQE